jgi:hypothetical protein
MPDLLFPQVIPAGRCHCGCGGRTAIAGEARIIGPGAEQLAITFSSGLLEPDCADEVEAFIVTARTAFPRLLAALDAVLKLHQPGRVTILGALCKRHENHRHFSITRTEADDVRACPDCVARVYISCAGCGPQVSVDACPVRAAITAELTKGVTP